MQNPIVGKYPEMPKPEDFGIDWEKGAKGSAVFNLQFEAYQNALEVWKQVVQGLAVYEKEKATSSDN